jgi:hypothetical protein
MSSFIADNPAAAASPSPDDLRAQLQDAPPAQQLSLLPKLLSLGEPGQQVLMAFLQEQGGAPTVVTGRAYQLLRSLPDAPTVESFLTNHFPQGIYPLPAACEVDYSPIQAALAQQEFEAADRLTLQKMCELAGDNAVKRKWLYFTEVASFPVLDLQVLDQLWWLYSEGRFGFSRQRELWLGVGCIRKDDLAFRASGNCGWGWAKTGKSSGPKLPGNRTMSGRATPRSLSGT